MKSVLIITYYWPPGTGPGVLRWLTLSKYLAKSGVKVHILTVKPSNASYPFIDDTLNQRIHQDISIHYSNSLDPLRIVQLFKKKKKNAGYNEVSDKGFAAKLMNFVRSNFFIPDPRVGWNWFAIRKAKRIIRKHDIKNIITTSPPHSTQLIGKALKRKIELNWIADFRDPWTDIFYYNQFRKVPWVRRLNKKMELSILKSADVVLVVSDGLMDLFRSKHETCNIKVLPNGYDPENFNFDNSTITENQLVITYTGTITDLYHPQVLFEAIESINLEYPDGIVVRFIGSMSDNLRRYLSQERYESMVELLGRKQHGETVQLMSQSDILLLIIPDVEKARGIVTGKVFEYLATKKTILNIGPADGDAAKIISLCQAGKTFTRESSEEIHDFLLTLLQAKEKHGAIPNHGNMGQVEKYSRVFQAKEVENFLE